jgi:hypothetical protein
MQEPSPKLLDSLRDRAASAQPPEHALLLEQLSDRLLADFPAAWREVFLGGGQASVRFRQQPVALLCCDPSKSEWSNQDLSALAARCGGEFEPCRETAVFRFMDAGPALATAVLLQRASSERVQAAILTRTTTVATFDLFGEQRSLAVGSPLEDALAFMRKSSPGSIKVCAETYNALGSAMDQGAKGAIVTTEFVGDEVTSAFVTLPPNRQSEVSTFAGLGLM